METMCDFQVIACFAAGTLSSHAEDLEWLTPESIPFISVNQPGAPDSRIHTYKLLDGRAQ